MQDILNMNYWKSTNGPYEEIVYALAVNYNSHIFAGTFRSGVFRCNPYGTFWYQTSLRHKHITSLIITPDKYIIAGTKEKGVFRSIDNGVSWTQTTLNNIDINSLAFDNNSNIYAGSDCKGLFFSKNKGSYWEKLGLENKIIDSILVLEDKVIVGTDIGLFSYQNNEWEKINMNNHDYDINKISISQDKKIYIGTSKGLYITDHNLSVFIQQGKDIFQKNIWDIKFDINNTVFITTDQGVFTFKNSKWENVSSGLNSSKVYCLDFNQENYIYAGTYGWGVFKSKDRTN